MKCLACHSTHQAVCGCSMSHSFQAACETCAATTATLVRFENTVYGIHSNKLPQNFVYAVATAGTREEAHAKCCPLNAELADHEEPGVANADVHRAADASHVAMTAQQDIMAGAEVRLVASCT
jgi:hypothetical protein